jgi:exopolyphosphatase / guanosine-5'-triphosphate,3'-diphosphate pyrophosphatase
VRGACIDIGSNTTRLLVADCASAFPSAVTQRRAFTHVRRGVGPDGRIAEAKISEVVVVVSEQIELAKELGATDIAVVATAAVRRAANADALAAALQRHCGVAMRVLSAAEEARLAFVGACGALAEVGGSSGDELGVVDVGGGSSEMIVGRQPGDVAWSVSLPLGSGDLADACLHSDPPEPEEVRAARARVDAVLDGLEVPRATRAVAVGGSAASVCRIAGSQLGPPAFAATLGLLLAGPAAEVAERFALDIERVRLLPAGLVILEALQASLNVPLEVVGGGLREGVLMEMGLD